MLALGPHTRRVGSIVSWVAVTAVGVVLALVWLARFDYRLEQLCHFRLQLGAGALFLAGGALVIGSRAPAAALTALAALAAWPLGPLTWGGRPLGTRADLSVVVSNVYTANGDVPAVLAALAALDPDVAVLLEVDERWARGLAPLRRRLPHGHVEARSDNFGVALFTRHAPRSIEVHRSGPSDIPWLFAELTVRDAPVCLAAAHPLPPVSAEAARLQTELLDDVAARLAAAGSNCHLVLAGDLNSTPWAPTFARLTEHTGLRDSALGFGLQPSWPTHDRLPRIPIDHVLVSDGLRVTDRRLGPEVGSDHLPVYVVLEVR